MLIVALILAVIGLVALVAAVITGDEVIAWVCIGASGLGVVLLIVDAIRDRSRRRAELPAVVPGAVTESETTEVIEPVVEDETVTAAEDSDEEATPDTAAESDSAEDVADDISEEVLSEDHPEELVYDDPDYDTPSDDEAEFPEPAEEAAIHTVSEDDVAAEEDDVDGELTGDETGGAQDPEGDEYATEVRYTPSPEGSADTVVYSYSEISETEISETDIGETEDPQAGDDRRDQ